MFYRNFPIQPMGLAMGLRQWAYGLMLYRNMRKTARQLLQEVRAEILNLDVEYKRLEKEQDAVDERREELSDLAKALEKVLEGDPVEQPELTGIRRIVRERPTGTPLGMFLRETLADGKPKTVEEIAEIAKKTIPSETRNKSVRRMINFALYALSRHGAVTKDNNGRWQIKH